VPNDPRELGVAKKFYNSVLTAQILNQRSSSDGWSNLCRKVVRNTSFLTPQRARA
jgi:hypothetical protein